MSQQGRERIAEIVGEPYLNVFGRFWDGMSFLIASSRGVLDRLTVDGVPPRFTLSSSRDALDHYMAGLSLGDAEWPGELLVWQMYAHAIIESHGLLDEYLRACFELLSLSQHVAVEIDVSEGWEYETAERVREIETHVRQESEGFGQMALWNRFTRLRKQFSLDLSLGRPLTAGLTHHRRIRNNIVHGQLTPHVVMPDGSIGSMREYPPPPYVPLGLHVVRGAMSVALAAHRTVDASILGCMGVAEDPATAAMIEAEIASGRDEWLVDPWEPHPEHLFEPDVLARWRPGL